mgnify:FL=1
MDIDKLRKIKAVILDMDGVLWREAEPIGNLPEIFNKLKSLGIKVVLATNNATRTPRQYVEKLAGFGAAILEEQIVNSSMAVAYQLLKRFPGGGAVYIVGESGLAEALAAAGFYQSETNCLAVIASMDRTINFEKLKQATLIVRSGVPFYGTNPDKTYPTPLGLIPGAGAIIGALEIACGQEAIIAGKPNPTLYEFALEKLGTTPADTLVVGDRLETDILGGQQLGCPSALVLSGIATLEEALEHQPPVDYIFESLTELVDIIYGG